jgi:hypothetical protein
MTWMRSHAVTAVALTVSVLFVAPLWIISVPAMLDGPSRFAELYLLQNLPGDSVLSRFYEADWALIPALASDLLVLLLAHILPLKSAIAVFLSIGVACWVIGPFAIHRAMSGKPSALPLFGSIFAYNESFSAGWWDCYVGMGADLVLFAGWIWSARMNPILRYAVFSAIAGVIFVFHLFACAVLLLLIGAYEFGLLFAESPNWRRVLQKTAWLASLAIVPLGLYAASEHVASAGTFEWDPIHSWPHRFGSALEIAPYRPLWFFTGPVLALAIATLATKRARIDPRMAFLLGAVGIISLLLPLSAYGTWGVSFRLPALFCELLFSSFEWNLSPSQERGFLAVAFGIASLVVLALFLTWRQFDQQVQEFRVALNYFPEGSRIFTAMSDPFADKMSNSLYIHIGEFNITDRHGFSSNLLSTRGQHIVHPVPKLRGIATRSSREGLPPLTSELSALASGQGLSSKTAIEHRNILDWRCKFDDAIILRETNDDTVLPSGLKVLQQGSFFLLAEVVPSKGCADRANI